MADQGKFSRALEVTRAALADFDTKGVRRVVIDLRGNMGGGGPAEWASIFRPGLMRSR